MTLTRLESFPFDSRYDGYDDEGYPNYDRAVGAKTMRDVFAHFFSDGVFSDTTYPFRLTKAASGLAVTVNPGVIIINGGWGILPEATTLTLATGTTAGVIKYAVFARYDNNDEHRTIYLRTDASSAGGAVPEPSTDEANVTEYRIGYVTVPSNSANLANATITNEVGTSKCPYATPLFDIDAAEVLEDLRQDAQAAYDKYYALLQSAVDDTTAGHLQNQIDAHDGRIASLENEEIDAQALRAEMGLGDTTGVLQPAYGGTGLTSLDELGNVFFGKWTQVFNVTLNGTVGEYKEYDSSLPTVTFQPGWYVMSLEVSETSQNGNGTELRLPAEPDGSSKVHQVFGVALGAYTGKFSFESASDSSGYVSTYVGGSSGSYSYPKKAINIVYFAEAKTYTKGNIHYKLVSYVKGSITWKYKKLTCFD